MCRPVEVLLPSFVLFTFVRNVELGGVCVFICWQPFYSPSTSFSFCLKMFFNSPRVDSIFSRENWFSPSTVLSLATQELSSVTVVYFSFSAATSLSASSWVVIFLEADSAATKT